MKNTFQFLLFALLVISIPTMAQKDKSNRPSPPATAQGTIDGVNVKVEYSAPSAKGRKMLGGIEKFGAVWRTGANEATTIEIDKAVKLEGKDLAAGKYELFTVPGEKEWVIIIQKFGKQWGAYTYKDANDVLRVTVKAGSTSAFVETFNIAVEGDQIVLRWENTQVAFKVKG